MTTPAAARHADAELSLSNKAPAKSAATEKTRAEKNAELAASAAAMRERNTAEAREQQEEKPAPPPPREDIESIEWQLTDGRKVEFGPPAGISLTMKMAMHLPETAVNPLLGRVARVLMSVRSVDGKVSKPITNLVSLTVLANEMGDTAIDELAALFDQYWGDVRLSDLQLLKKNLRK